MKKLIAVSVLAMILSVGYSQKKKATPYIINYKFLPKTSLPVSGTQYRSEIVTGLYPLSFNESEEAREKHPGNYEEQQAALVEAKERKMAMYAFSNLKIDGLNHKAVNENENYLLNLIISDPIATKYPEGRIKEMKSDDAVFEYYHKGIISIKKADGSVVWTKEFTKQMPSYQILKKNLVLNPVVKLSLSNAEDEGKLDQILNDFVKSDNDQHLVIAKFAIKANEILNEEFGSYVKGNNVGLFYVKGKGYDDINDLSDEFATLYRGFNAISEKKRLPKSDMDAFFEKAIPVWEKTISEKANDLEPEALEGLQLNCALGYAWLGQFEEAGDMIQSAEHAELGEGETSEERLVVPAVMNMQAYADNVVGLYSHFSQGLKRIEILH